MYSITAVRAAMWLGKSWWYISVFKCEKNDSSTTAPADPDLSHGLRDIVSSTPFLEVAGGVLRAPIGIKPNSA